MDRVTNVAFATGKVVTIGDNLAGSARDVTGSFATPGVIDLHTQGYFGGASPG